MAPVFGFPLMNIYIYSRYNTEILTVGHIG